MIAKGNLHGDGAKLATYLLKGEDGEIAKLIETRGLEGFGSDPVSAFDALQQVADAQTNATMPFFHIKTRLPAGECLTDAQWLEVADREEKRLGFQGQPRILSFHIDPESGEKHLHGGWFRIDLDTMRAIDPGMFKNHLMQLARVCERDYGLRELENTRQPHDRARVADRDEVEESRRLGSDVRAIRTAILHCFEHSDNGASFKAALEDKNLILANGDKRDCFVVIDPEGGHHALNKKLTGQTLAATRDRLADLDRSQLPSVEEAKALQAERISAPEIVQEHRQQPAAEPARETWAEAVRSFRAAPEAPEPAPEAAPANQRRSTAEQIEADAVAAKHRSEDGQSFKAVLEASGDYVLARGDRRDFLIIDSQGDAHSLSRRLGLKAAETRSFMADLDPASLPSVEEAKAIQAERRHPSAEPVRETWAEAVRSFQPIPEPLQQTQEPKPAEQQSRPVFEVSTDAIVSGR